MSLRPNSPTLASSSLITTVFLVASMAMWFVFLVTGSRLLAPDEFGLLGVSLAILTFGGLVFSPLPWALAKYHLAGMLIIKAARLSGATTETIAGLLGSSFKNR